MGAPRWPADPALIEQLYERGYEFDFFQAVRVLARVSKSHEPIAAARHAGEAVRFNAQVALRFPPSAICRIERDQADQARSLMTVAFMGLTGPHGVLPYHYTERIIARVHAKNRTLADFFDLFNHRFISWFYRAWEKHRFFVGYERTRAGTDRSEGLTTYLLDLIGLGVAGLQNRMRVPDRALLLYAGLMAQRPHSATALEGILQDYFQVRVQVEQFHGKWLALDAPTMSYMETPGLQNALGVGAVAGDAVWNHQARFRVRVGPVGFDRFLAFLPNGQAFVKLVELTGFFTGLALGCDVQLVLRARDVPWCRLDDDGADAPRLGWIGWLKTEEFQHDASDAEFVVKN